MDIVMLIKVTLRITNKFIILLGLQILSSCTSINETDAEQVINPSNEVTMHIDTVFMCDTTKIGKLVWMAEDLQVETFRNGDSIKKVTSYEEWKEAENANTPALYIVEIDKKEYQDLIKFYNDILSIEYKILPAVPNNTTYYLYNLAAIRDERLLAPKGWKIPHYTDWDYLLDYVRAQRYLLCEEGVIMSFGNPYKFSLLPTPNGFVDKQCTFNINFATYWALEEKLISICTFQVNEWSAECPRPWHDYNCRKYQAACIRCIRE